MAFLGTFGAGLIVLTVVVMDRLSGRIRARFIRG